MPDDIWQFVSDNGFLGMLISKEHGGLGFSAQAQSLILGKIASRCPDGVTIVMVPNSLGPGELIEKYGTDAQKEHFLPRLARGEEVPCFALTGRPRAPTPPPCAMSASSRAGCMRARRSSASG